MWIKPTESLPADETQVIVKLDRPKARYAIANYFADKGFKPANVQVVAKTDSWEDYQVMFFWKVLAWRPVDCLEE